MVIHWKKYVVAYYLLMQSISWVAKNVNKVKTDSK
jgi:hypothetical protein